MDWRDDPLSGWGIEIANPLKVSRLCHGPTSQTSARAEWAAGADSHVVRIC